MKRLSVLLLAICFLAGASDSPVFASWDSAKVEQERQKVEETISRFKENNPAISRFFDNAYAYAVFPTIGKGAFIIGAAKGSGLVYEQGEIVGKVTLGQATVGLQAGGQAYSQVIFFYDKVALENLKDNRMKFSGQVSAIAATAGASADIDYEGGVAVFTLGKAGLMLEASIGGQDFEFEAKPSDSEIYVGSSRQY